MRLAIAVLSFALVPSLVLAAGLPLADGDYTRGQCKAGSSDFLESFDIQTITEGPRKGSRLLYPQAEGQDGNCTIDRINVSGSRYSGSAKCEDGGSRIRYDAGTYKFSIEVLSARSFLSKGKKYVWCASHR